jgi:hypothetical protein
VARVRPMANVMLARSTVGQAAIRRHACGSPSGVDAAVRQDAAMALFAGTADAGAVARGNVAESTNGRKAVNARSLDAALRCRRAFAVRAARPAIDTSIGDGSVSTAASGDAGESHAERARLRCAPRIKTTRSVASTCETPMSLRSSIGPSSRACGPSPGINAAICEDAASTIVARAPHAWAVRRNRTADAYQPSATRAVTSAVGAATVADWAFAIGRAWLALGRRCGLSTSTRDDHHEDDDPVRASP